MGLVGAAMPLGAAAGPPLGAVLLGLGGWPSIFLVNLPLVAVALVLGARALPRTAARRARMAFDHGGAVLLSATLVAGAWSLNGAGLGPAAGLALGALAAILAAALVVFELRRPDPVVQPRLFAHPAFSAAAGGVALSNLAMYVTLLALPVLLEHRGGGSVASAGVLLATMSAASLLATPFGGRLTDRTGSRAPAVVGLALQAAMLVPLAFWPAGLPVVALAACLLVAGAGLGLASSALQVAAVAAVDVSDAGMATGLFSTSRYAGSIVGTALLAGPLAPAGGGTAGFGLLFGVLAAAAGASVVAASALPAGTPAGRLVGAPARA